MPEVQRSFYADMAAGLDYFGYVAVELPAMCERMFGLPHERTKRYVMGLSMGGYGALKLALRPRIPSLRRIGEHRRVLVHQRQQHIVSKTLPI